MKTYLKPFLRVFVSSCLLLFSNITQAYLYQGINYWIFPDAMSACTSFNPISPVSGIEEYPPYGAACYYESGGSNFVRMSPERYGLFDDANYGDSERCVVGNPIDLVTGNKRQKEPLIRLEAPHLIEFNLYFNSRRLEKWRHSYSRSLKVSTVQPTRYHFDVVDGLNPYALPVSSGGFGFDSTRRVFFGQVMVPVSERPVTYSTPQSACEGGWGAQSLKYHYSWISGSVAEYVAGQCLIKDSNNRLRMTLSVYSLYTGHSMFGGQRSSGISHLLFTRGNGSEVYFKLDSVTNEWINQMHSGEQAETVYAADGTTVTGYRLYTNEDEIEDYDKQGRLDAIVFPDGYVQTLSYDPDTGLLQRVQNPTGEYIDFHYETFGDINQFHRIDYVTDHTGRVWSFRYFDTGSLAFVDHPDLTVRQYHYEDLDFPFNLTGITDERDVRYANWDYDANGRAISSSHGPAENIDRVDIERPTAHSRKITATRISSVTGLPTHRVTTYGTHSGGGRPLVAQVSGPGCSSCSSGDSSYDYDAQTGYLMSRTEHGRQTEYGDYDANSNPGYIIEAVGTADERRKDYTYDPRFHSKVATITEPSVFAGASKVTSYAYDSSGNMESVSTTGFRPDGTAISRTSTMQYLGPYHQITQRNGPRTDVNDIISFTYYPDTVAQGNNRARLSQISGPDGTPIRSNINYTTTSKILNESRANNLYISYSYYPGNDRLHEMNEQDTISGLFRITRWTYLPTGEVESITQGAGSIDATSLTLDYDDARRLTRITDGLGHYIEYILDSEGNVEQENYHDASGNLKKTLTQTFDLYNRLNDFSQLNEAVDADYNPDGTLDRSTDGKGVVTDHGYDSLLRLTSMTRDLGGTDSTTANALTQYGYDAQDHLTSVTDANGGQTLYVYDDLGNLLSQTSPDTGTTGFTHDEAGNIASKTDAKGQLFSYAYDGYNRLTLIDAPGSIDDVQLTYDTCPQGYGRLCQVQRHNSMLVYHYNGFGERTGLDHGLVTWEGYNRADAHVGYSYDSAGRIKTISYPSGAIVTYSYDAAGQVVSVDLEQHGSITRLADNAYYQPFGPLGGQIYGNGLNALGIYDTAYRPGIIGTPASYVNIGSYDNNGNITTLSTSMGMQSYSYDDHNRLDTSSGSFGAFDYAYDLVGNKASQSIDGATEAFSYEPNSNRMNAANAPVVLDANGNTTGLRGMTLGYTADNRLKSVNTGVAFEYDGLGQRASKKSTAPGAAGAAGWYQTAVFLYGQNGQLLAELGPSGKVIKEYIYMNAQPLAMLVHKPDSGENFLHGDMDGDGSISVEDYLVWYINLFNVGDVSGDVTGDGILTTDDTNVVVNCALVQGSCEAASYASTLYYIHNDHLGTPKMLTDTSGTPVWRSVARPFGKATVNDDVDGDGERVTFNLRQPGQYYDRETGRYITSDPIGLAGGINIYAYVENNPLNYVDPLGLSPFGPKPGLTPLIRPHSTFYPKPSPIPKPNGVPQPRINESPQAYKNRLDQWVKDRNSNLKSETRQPSSNSLGNKTKEKVDGFAKLLKKFMESLKDGDFGAMPPILPYPDLPADHPLNKPQC
jgi:YD repeat-containing protein